MSQATQTDKRKIEVEHGNDDRFSRQSAAVAPDHDRLVDGEATAWAEFVAVPRDADLAARIAAIPPTSATARTAGAMKGGPVLTIEEERAAFEWAVARENAQPTEQ